MDLEDSRINVAMMKLEGQLDMVEYIRITVPESVHMGDPPGSYMEMLKARLCESAPDGLEREASHAGVSERADGDF